MESVLNILKTVKNNANSIAYLNDDERNGLLKACSLAIQLHKNNILKQNEIDVDNAIKNNKLTSFIDRLTLTNERIDKMCEGIDVLCNIKSPVGNVLDTFITEKELHINKICVPLGVIAIVFEARPNVTSDCIALAIKSGNAIVLRGGSDAINSNIAIVKAIKDGIRKCGVSPDFIGLIEDTSHESVNYMLKQREYIDVIIPRGGQSLIRSTIANSTVPVIETGLGNCHIYINKNANIAEGIKIAVSAKISRVSVCNSAEKLLIDRSIAKSVLPMIVEQLKMNNVVVKGDREVANIVDVLPCTEEDYYKEYNDYILTIKIVEDVVDAANWINKYSTHHSDSIISENENDISIFTKLVDSACVFVNTTTRYSDGFEFGFGAEVGISTQKLHARGPMGLKELTTYKYVIDSKYLIR